MEDKEVIAVPLSNALQNYGLTTWLDIDRIKAGDSIIKEISKGISKSNYAVCIISPNYIKKPWAIAELESILNLNIAGKIKIIPVWHNIDYSFVVENFPLLIDKLALKSSLGIEEIAYKIFESIKKDLPEHKNDLKDDNVISFNEISFYQFKSNITLYKFETQILWPEINNKIKILINEIEATNCIPDYILGIDFSGMVLGSLISNQLLYKQKKSVPVTPINFSHFDILEFDSNKIEAKNILLSTSVNISGLILKKLTEIFTTTFKFTIFRTYSFIHFKETEFEPTFKSKIIEQRDSFYIFPWLE